VRTRGAAEIALLLGRYVEDLRARRYSVSHIEKTRFELPRLFLHLKRQGVSDVRAVSEAHLAAYARHLERHKTRKGEPLTPGSRAATLNVVRRFFAALEACGVILRNPALAIPLPKGPRLPRGILTKSQARRLMAAPFPYSAIGRRDRAILETLYGTGIRVGEAARVDTSDLDLREGVLLVRNGKGRKDRVVPVPGRAVAALDVYLTLARPDLAKRFDPALFLSIFGVRLQAPGMRVMIEKHGRAIGVSLTPHTLRHTCATHLLKGGADIRHVQELLGHKRLMTTALYTRVAIADLRAVVARSHPRESDRQRGARR
jgi:integrase/recombinase XerD